MNFESHKFENNDIQHQVAQRNRCLCVLYLRIAGEARMEIKRPLPWDH